MAFTYLSPLNQRINNLLKFPVRPFLITHKPYYSDPINFTSPLISKKICATITDVSFDLKNKVEKSRNREGLLPLVLEEDLMPKHIAIVMDGNRRWAAEKGLPPMAGHNAMRMALKPLLRKCSELKLKAVSIYAFSTENWNRPKEEVDFLMEMFEALLTIDTKELLSLGCRVSVMGDKTMLSKTLQNLSAEIEEISRFNLGTHVNYAINYSGKYDIIQACRSLVTQVKEGALIPSQINEKAFIQELETKNIDFPYPDLVIRTSGEIRLSNFMLWQMADSELYFVQKCFPDFEEKDLIEAILTYQETQAC